MRKNNLFITVTVAIVCTLFSHPVQAATNIQVLTQEQYQYEQDINALLDATNAERTAAGAPALVLDEVLCEDAEVRASECTTLYSHTRPDGSDWFTLDPTNMWGENLAEGYSVADVTSAWMASPKHKENLVNPEFTKVGFAITEAPDGTQYITQEFSY